MSASKGKITVNRGRNRRPRPKCEDNRFNCGKEGHRAGDCSSAKRSKKPRAADGNKKGACSGKCCICGSEIHLAHMHVGLCRGLEHRAQNCKELGAKKGVMRAKLTLPAGSDGGIGGGSSW